ncbi:MAG: hypothetical protein Q4E05_04925 [Pseudoclavibacter sp.]|nr:hypothetical protein [Pseudoclavibacter sp.]
MQTERPSGPAGPPPQADRPPSGMIAWGMGLFMLPALIPLLPLLATLVGYAVQRPRRRHRGLRARRGPDPARAVSSGAEHPARYCDPTANRRR